MRIKDLLNNTAISESSLWESTPKAFFIYGIGLFAQDIQQVLQKHSFKFLGFLDHRKNHAGTIDSLPIYLPNDPVISLEQRRGATVILGVHNWEANVTTIINKLRELGFNNIVSSIALHDNFAKEIQSVYNLRSDEKSREIFESLIRFRTTGDYSFLPEPDMKHQYFPPDLPSRPQPIRFVDCDTYGGDTLQSLLSARHKFEAIAAFEPDDVNFPRLSRFVSSHVGEIPDATLYPYGVYVSTTRLSFETGQGEASVIFNKGGNVVQCVALLGARQIINKFLPVLAVSIYHLSEHLWQVPLFLEEIAPQKYGFYIRSHAGSTFDTVL